MYNLAKRQGLPKVGETPDNVAANTYIFDDYKTFQQNRAPFLSKTERSFVIGRKLYTQAVYNPEKAQRHIQGGSSIKNKTDRTFFTPTDTPGPAAYDPKKITKKKPFASNLPPPGKGKLYLCTPPRLGQSSPSIPTKIDENGYYVNDSGKLAKIPPDDYDTSLGPAFYHIDINPFCGTNRYKGCEWSKRRAKRSTTDTNNNPGPATYDIQTEIGRMDPRDEYVREMARLYSYIPRTLEANELRIVREGLPGPGQYDINASTLKGHKHTGIHPPPLVIAANRFTYREADTPGPNCYNLQDYPKRRRCSLLGVPFGSEAPRASLKLTSYGPGPAGYNISGPLEETQNRKRNYYGTVNSPFNSTAMRKLDFIEKDTLYLPGPANYIVEPLEMPKNKVTCCHLRSKTTRFHKLRKCENAEPATYSISETFNKNRDRTSHNTGKVSFQSRQPKCIERIPDNPGPADYLAHTAFEHKNMTFNKTTRFPDTDTDYPGPGAYVIDPRYSDSIYNSYATYNLRLKENVLHQKLRLPPGRTWESWYKEMKKKKKLKCFSSFEKRMYDYVGMLFRGIDFTNKCE